MRGLHSVPPPSKLQSEVDTGLGLPQLGDVLHHHVSRGLHHHTGHVAGPPALNPRCENISEV